MPEHVVEFFHGYTYSGHPVSCAAAIATLDLYRQENLFARAGEMGKVLGDAFHSTFKGLPNVIGIRSLGLFDRLPNPESYLSGLLIGHEVRAASPGGQTVHLIGEARLCALYARAIGQCGGSPATVGEDAAAAGLALIGEHAAWT